MAVWNALGIGPGVGGEFLLNIYSLLIGSSIVIMCWVLGSPEVRCGWKLESLFLFVPALFPSGGPRGVIIIIIVIVPCRPSLRGVGAQTGRALPAGLRDPAGLGGLMSR